ncbi:MAG: 4-(cytidine 5'-diphospho)-2-C-methyl-D-erythritol kinase [Bacteroides sp.]|nr:4-(cytidine 5'-diphospho)-2-C-methyl-D-erythritol kinase [Bacteroides sp.]MCM1456694.1 4-(cytidine 5'-diphospho)-2-C-methyl-D-erythritol kinase [Lachnoclostridium sp.]
MILFSDCKINIGLDITARRPDGYHDISTVMVHIPWHDIIELLPAKGNAPSLTVVGRSVDCPPEKNLVMKAFRVMEREYGIPPVDIVLEKIIPDGAGLGGGSADAATTLKGLNEMFGLNVESRRLAELASEIGADCPFFIYDTPMYCTGIGTVMQPVDVDLSGRLLLVAKPEGVSVSTREAYLRVVPQIPDVALPELLDLPVEMWQGRVKNDFESSVFAVAPQVRELKEMMLAEGAAYASMSGSGASVYGIFNDDKLADNARSRCGSLISMMCRM